MTNKKSSNDTGYLFSGEDWKYYNEEIKEEVELLSKVPNGLEDIANTLHLAKKKFQISYVEFARLTELSFKLHKREDYLQAVIKELAKVRRIRGETQEEVNDKIGVADRLVNKWECGDKYPNGFSLFCFCEALNCKLMAVPVDLHLQVRELIEKWYDEQE